MPNKIGWDWKQHSIVAFIRIKKCIFFNPLGDGSCLSRPQVDNVIVSPGTPPYSENTRFDFECIRGYRQMVETNERYTCNQNIWNGNLTCEQVFCPNDFYIAPNVQLVNPQTDYPVDFELKFICDSTYALEGDSKVVCLLNGEWSSSNQTKCE